MDSTDGLVLVIRDGKVLARPTGMEPVPTVGEIDEFISIIDSTDHGGIRVVRSSTGKPPEGWRWMNVFDLQVEADGDETIGEAILCS